MQQKTLADVEASLNHTLFPQSLILDTINMCNYSCSICARRRMTRPKGKMPFALAKRLLDEISVEAPMTKVWLVFYGEPLLAAERIALLSTYARSRGIKNLHLNTNASLLDEDKAEIILNSGISQVVVSVDGFSDATYDSMRQPGFRSRVYYNLQRFLDMSHGRSDAPEIIAQIVRCEKTESEIDIFTDYWKARGATVKIKEHISWTAPSEKEWDSKNRIACPWIFTTLPVLWTGKTALCGADYDGAGSVGNIADGIKGLWNGAHRIVRDIHLQHRFEDLPAICKKCTDWNILGSDIKKP